jgi:hypothetical protein
VNDEIPPPPPRLEQRQHGGNHMFLSVPNRTEREAWAAARWAVNNWTYRRIGEAMDVSEATAYRYVQAGLRVSQEIAEATAEQARAVHRSRLEYATEVAIGVMEKDHIHVSQGRVVKDDDGLPLLEDGPKLAAADRVRALSESLRKLDGIDAATKLDTNLTVKPQDIELAEIVRQVEEENQALEARIRGENSSE